MTHTHGTPASDRPFDPTIPFDRDYWEDRYSAPGFAWSGNPNAVLVTEASALEPGRALDIGSGEGGDSIWLASRGWQVTGIDISQNALDKSRAKAESLDADLAARITWQQRDLSAWLPAPASFDLVSSQFMHLALPLRTTLFRALAAAVAPGGTLLIVGHDVTGRENDEHSAHLRELMFDAPEVVAAISGEGLVVEAAESRSRQVTDAEGNSTPMWDVVVRASRPRA